MTIIKRAAIAAVCATCALSPLAAAAAPVRETVTARIRTADLNLTSPAGRHGLHRRLAIAANRACGLDRAQWHNRADAERCYHEMMADGSNQIATLTSHRPVQVASVERR